MLIAGLALILTLILSLEGIAGTEYKKKQEKKRRLAAGIPKPRSRLATMLSRSGEAEATSAAER